MRRVLTAADREAWQAFLQDAPKKPSPAPAPATRASPAAKPRAPSPLVTGAHPPGLDTSTWTRLRNGKLTPERQLDLHGRTLAAAHGALRRFLEAAHAEQVRCVEVITGKGAQGAGAIRRELPFWLNEPNLRALVVASVHPHAANPGAVRLLIRRVRSGRRAR